MKTAAIIITDEGFLVPSLALANSIATSPLSSLTDTLLFLVDVGKDIQDQVALSDLGKRFDIIPVNFREFGVSEQSTFKPGHVSKTALGRLAIHDRIPDCYDNIIYMDGDMQIIRDAEKLFTYIPPEGRIAACAEHFFIYGQDPASRPLWLNRYLDSICLSSPEQYFNSGLLAFRRDTWQEVGSRALKFFNDHSALCHHHDQTALNAVCRGKWEPLSVSYNYQSFFMPLCHRTHLDMKIAHFTSSPKPWQSTRGFWPARHALPYKKLLEEFPFLRSCMNSVASAPLSDRMGLQRLKALRRRFVDRRQIAQRSDAFNAYLERTDFVVQ